MFKSPPPILANVVVFEKGTVDGRESANARPEQLLMVVYLERVWPRDGSRNSHVIVKHRALLCAPA